MKLRRVLVIAGKEFRDVLRDRRTLFFMLLLPIVVMPAIMVLISNFMKAQLREKEQRVLVVAADRSQQQILRALGDRWMSDNMPEVLAATARIGIEGFGGLRDLGNVAERVQELKDDDREGQHASAIASAWSALSEDQQQVLEDAGSVGRVLELTKWVDIGADVDVLTSKPGALPPGVQVPADLPGRLSDPRVARAITDKEKAIHAAVAVAPDEFADWVDTDPARAVSLPITILYDASQSLSREAHDRFEAFSTALTRSEIRTRLAGASLARDFVRPFALHEANLATRGREMQAVIGGLLPYLVILFCFFGAFYPALDLTAGEKERFTLETLLLAPVSRVEIAAGKFVVVFATAVTAAVLTTASLAITLTQGILPEAAVSTMNLRFELPSVLLTASLLVPVGALFASLLLTVALCARSFKEAQSYAMPLQFLIILPAMTALMPDLQSELKWAWVPLMNVSLLMRELLKGNYLWDFYFITLGSMLALSMLALWVAGRVFRRESVLLRT